MGTSFDASRLSRVAAGVLTAIGVLVVAGTGIVSGDVTDAGAYLDAARSATHLLGLGASILLAYYAVRARQRFAGGVFGDSAVFTAVGALLFAAAFLVMELNHGLGIDVLAGFGDMQLQMAVSMLLFTGTVFAFGWAFARIAGALGGSNP